MQSTEFCSIATVDPEGVWSNPVYFAWDSNFNIFFISQPDSRHMKNIANDQRVAMSIYNTKQSTFDDVAGIQLEGRAEVLTNPKNIKYAYATYYGRKYPDTGRNQSGKNEDAYINNPEWLFVRVALFCIYYFDTRFFGENRVEVPLDKLRQTD